MAGAKNTPEKGESKAWTDDAKFQFLLRIVAQLRQGGQSINWHKIDMPGRTTKSLQNMWYNINKSIADLEGSPSGRSSAETPRKQTAKKTPSRKNVDLGNFDDNDDSDDIKREFKGSPSKKRARNGNTPSARDAKRLKTEDEEDIKIPSWEELGEGEA